MSQSEPFELHVNCHELSLSHKSFILIVMYMYILVPGHLIPGDLLLTWVNFNPSVDK